MIDNQKMSLILPARIVEYFPDTQTATIQISAETVFNDAVSVAQSKIREPLEDVPVHTPSGGGWSLTVPIATGDTCLIVFSQIGYDHWLHKDKDTAGKLASLPKPWLSRQFSDDDGFAMVGFNTLPRAIQDYSMDGSQWRNENSIQNIHLKEDLSIEINSPVSVTINAPSVVVNCETSEVVASTSVTLDSPVTNVTGVLNVEGITNTKGVANTGTMSSTGDVTAAGKSVSTHTHAVLAADFGDTDVPS